MEMMKRKPVIIRREAHSRLIIDKNRAIIKYNQSGY